MFAHYQNVATFAENFEKQWLLLPIVCFARNNNSRVFIYTMATENKKRRLITSFHNLTAEQQAEVKALYPLGFTEVMTRYDKPDGTFFYTVPYETEDTYYMVKIDVKVDDGQEDEGDGYYDEDDLKGADELADASEEPSDEDF